MHDHSNVADIVLDEDYFALQQKSYDQVDKLLRLDLLQEQLKLVVLELEAKGLDVAELEQSDAFASSTFAVRGVVGRLVFYSGLRGLVRIVSSRRDTQEIGIVVAWSARGHVCRILGLWLAGSFLRYSITLCHLDANVAFHLRIEVEMSTEDSDVQLHDGREVENWELFAAILATAHLGACFPPG